VLSAREELAWKTIVASLEADRRGFRAVLSKLKEHCDKWIVACAHLTPYGP
jgi:hypothetical protein